MFVKRCAPTSLSNARPSIVVVAIIIIIIIIIIAKLIGYSLLTYI